MCVCVCVCVYVNVSWAVCRRNTACPAYGLVSRLCTRERPTIPYEYRWTIPFAFMYIKEKGLKNKHEIKPDASPLLSSPLLPSPPFRSPPLPSSPPPLLPFSPPLLSPRRRSCWAFRIKHTSLNSVPVSVCSIYVGVSLVVIGAGVNTSVAASIFTGSASGNIYYDQC